MFSLVQYEGRISSGRLTDVHYSLYPQNAAAKNRVIAVHLNGSIVVQLQLAAAHEAPKFNIGRAPSQVSGKNVNTRQIANGAGIGEDVSVKGEAAVIQCDPRHRKSDEIICIGLTSYAVENELVGIGRGDSTPVAPGAPIIIPAAASPSLSHAGNRKRGSGNPSH